MALLTWTGQYELGVPEIDQQHEKLVGMLHALEAGVRHGYSRRILASILSDLARYTVRHFTFEERLMRTNNLPFAEEHKAEHRKLARDVLNYQRRFDLSHADVSDELLFFLSDWLKGHILGTDRRLVDALLARLDGQALPQLDEAGCRAI